MDALAMYWPVLLLNTVAFGLLVFGDSKERGVSPFSIYMAIVFMITADNVFRNLRAAP